MPQPQINTFTITLAGISDRATLEGAIRELYGYSPDFVTTRIEVVAHRHLGRFVVQTKRNVSSFLDTVGDLFCRVHKTPVVWPAPSGDRLPFDAPSFVYPPTLAPVETT